MQGADTASAPAISVPTAKIPGASLTPRIAEDDSLERLMETFRVDCLYGAGYGGNWTNGLPSPHTAAWQGGQVIFDTIDLVAGTAMLKTTSGLTRTDSGELEVSVQGTQTGLHFSVFAPGGELIMATVYGRLDAKKLNAAVISFHGPHLNNESAQFYGACAPN